MKTVTIVTLALLLSLTYTAKAWVEPSQMPPGGNIAAPLNTGNVGQSKAGGLILNTMGALYGLIVDQGNTGLGTRTPTEKLEVCGNIKLCGETPVNKVTNLALPTEGSDAANKDYVDTQDAGIIAYIDQKINELREYIDSKLAEDNYVSGGLYGFCVCDGINIKSPATLSEQGWGKGVASCKCPDGFELLSIGNTGCYLTCYKE